MIFDKQSSINGPVYVAVTIQGIQVPDGRTLVFSCNPSKSQFSTAMSAIPKG